MGKHLNDCDTVALDEARNAVIILDQTLLPGRTELVALRTARELWEAIYLLKVRGAPAIGVAAALGISVLMQDVDTEDFTEFCDALRKYQEYLNSARPTAVNLSWALKRMERAARQARAEGLSVAQAKERLRREALRIRREDVEVCRRIGENGLSLLKPGDGILTHCNAGRLAAVRYGTATAPIYLGQERGYGFRVYADETRPFLQGARLTAYELREAGVDVTLLCDNMSASLMARGLVQAVLVGCDRVAANGDTANKIGTFMAALAAKRCGVPFYVCAPSATIDLDTPTGREIPIEMRPEQEVTEMWYGERMAPFGVKVYNPAFDVTPQDLITGIVTEYGVLRAPYEKTLRGMMEGRER